VLSWRTQSLTIPRSTELSRSYPAEGTAWKETGKCTLTDNWICYTNFRTLTDNWICYTNFHTKLQIIFSHLSCMKNKTTENSSDRCHYRFNILLSLLRLGGIPLKTKSISKVTMTYNAIIIVCFYITNVCLCMDVFVHRHDLVQCMKKMRLLFPLQVITWTHFSLR
jgi:hypothetical protein